MKAKHVYLLLHDVFISFSKIPANCESIQSGYLTIKTGGGGSKPVKRWFALLPDFVLYSFKSADASDALTATPIPGHAVVSGSELRGDPMVSEKERDRIVKLFYAPNPFNSNNNASSSPVPVAARKTYYLAGNSNQEMERFALQHYLHFCFSGKRQQLF